MGLGKILAWGAGLTLLGFGIKKGLDLSGKADAAAGLKMDFGSLNVLRASLKEGILFNVILKATNNSAHELKFSQPFVEVSILDSKNKFTTIAASNDASGIISLPARKTSNLKFNLNISPTQALKLPGLLMHVVKKVAGLNPTPKKVLVEYGLSAEGINIKQKSDVLL